MDIASIAKLIGSSGAGAMLPIVIMYQGFTPLEDHNRLVAENMRGYILDVMEKAENEPPGPFKDSLCRTLTEAIAELCASAPDDAICVDRGMYLERAGC